MPAERPVADAELSEHFIAALLVDIPDEDTVAHMTNCGHPPRLLLHERGEVTTLSAAQPASPMGMCGLPNGSSASGTPDTFAFEDGEPPLLYTDGVIEARAPTGPSIRWPNGSGSGGAPVPKGCCTTSAAICWTMPAGGWTTTPPWWSSGARPPSTRSSS
ncbi:SpoIIE family protein phosphatase [Streptomyces sp. NPDC007875]|uniref:SpoIIE family protein phosphatase n=1 Tax=Streptomyces sp. NPDC007875 TaxID=3364783 RepID=UPI0036CF0A8D